MTQSLTETWQTGLRVFRQLPSATDSTPCQTLLLKIAVLVQERLEKVETLQRYLKTLLSVVFSTLKGSLVKYYVIQNSRSRPPELGRKETSVVTYYNHSNLTCRVAKNSSTFTSVRSISSNIHVSVSC